MFGLPALRLRGHYLALATFALAVAMPQILKYKHIEQWTGGVQGIVIIKPDPPFGLKITPDQWLYLFTLAILIVMFVLGWNLLRGRVGRAMVAIRDHPIAAEAMGVNSALFKTLTFGVSALYTGVAGALGAIVVQFVAPDSFTAGLSINFLVGIVVGRRRIDLGCPVRRAVHPVRAQFRRPDLQGRPLGDLRRVPAGLRLRDADRRSRLRAHGLRQAAAGQRGWRVQSRATRSNEQEE